MSSKPGKGEKSMSKVQTPMTEKSGSSGRSSHLGVRGAE